MLICQVNLFAADLTVFAAASLTETLQQVGAAFERKSGHRVVFNFASSSTLARQIIEGAPADIFFSADEAKMDQVESQRLLATGTRRSLLGNTLVIVTSPELQSVKEPSDLARSKLRRIAIAEPSTVPAGIYAKRYLEKHKLWERVKDKLISTENVRAALAAVEAGNVDAAIVYKTDAAISNSTRIACEIPAAETPDISYTVAVIKGTKQAEAARDFLAFVQSPTATDVFKRSGFIVR